MNFELCTDSVEGAIIASHYGFKSVELCSALGIGGLTPGFGLIKACVDQSNLEVHVMIRHKEGGFVYDQKDVEVMKKDIEAAKAAGAHGVVFGILDPDNSISDLNQQLVQQASMHGLKSTFHRAFDFVNNHKEAIKKINDFGFDRLLTSGLEERAEDGIEIIADLEQAYGHRIQIIAGSGVSEKNARIFAHSGIKTLHFTARKMVKETIKLGMGVDMPTDENKIKSILSLFK
jgi:copper homeostasis protein